MDSIYIVLSLVAVIASAILLVYLYRSKKEKKRRDAVIQDLEETSVSLKYDFDKFLFKNRNLFYTEEVTEFLLKKRQTNRELVKKALQQKSLLNKELLLEHEEARKHFSKGSFLFSIVDRGQALFYFDKINKKCKDLEVKIDLMRPQVDWNFTVYTSINEYAKQDPVFKEKLDLYLNSCLIVLKTRKEWLGSKSGVSLFSGILAELTKKINMTGISKKYLADFELLAIN